MPYHPAIPVDPNAALDNNSAKFYSNHVPILSRFAELTVISWNLNATRYQDFFYIDGVLRPDDAPEDNVSKRVATAIASFLRNHQPDFINLQGVTDTYVEEITQQLIGEDYSFVCDQHTVVMHNDCVTIYNRGRFAPLPIQQQTTEVAPLKGTRFLFKKKGKNQDLYEVVNSNLGDDADNLDACEGMLTAPLSAEVALLKIRSTAEKNLAQSARNEGSSSNNPRFDSLTIDGGDLEFDRIAPQLGWRSGYVLCEAIVSDVDMRLGEITEITGPSQALCDLLHAGDFDQLRLYPKTAMPIPLPLSKVSLVTGDFGMPIVSPIDRNPLIVNKIDHDGAQGPMGVAFSANASNGILYRIGDQSIQVASTEHLNPVTGKVYPARALIPADSQAEALTKFQLCLTFEQAFDQKLDDEYSLRQYDAFLKTHINIKGALVRPACNMLNKRGFGAQLPEGMFSDLCEVVYPVSSVFSMDRNKHTVCVDADHVAWLRFCLNILLLRQKRTYSDLVARLEGLLRERVSPETEMSRQIVYQHFNQEIELLLTNPALYDAAAVQRSAERLDRKLTNQQVHPKFRMLIGGIIGALVGVAVGSVIGMAIAGSWTGGFGLLAGALIGMAIGCASGASIGF